MKLEAVEKKLESDEELPKIFVQVVEDYTGGNPQEIQRKWVGLKPKEIHAKLVERDYEVSYYLIHQLLSNAGLGKRSYLKSLSQKSVPNRNTQFEKEYFKSDTKMLLFVLVSVVRYYSANQNKGKCDQIICFKYDTSFVLIKNCNQKNRK